MRSWRLDRLRSIKWQLPVGIAALLTIVVAAMATYAHREVRAAALSAAGTRLDDVGRQLATLLGQSAGQRIAETRAVAGDPAVVAAVASAGAASRAPAMEVMAELAGSSPQVAAVELRDADGARVLVGHPPEGAEDPASAPWWTAGDTAAVSGFRSDGDAVWYEAAAAVRPGGRTIGYAVQRRLLSSSPDAVGLIQNLIGMQAAFYVGQPTGPWTDLAGVVDGPDPAAVRDGGIGEYVAVDGERRMGTTTPIAGTPWQVWVEFPTATVLERPGRFLAHTLPFGVAIVLLGVAGGWALSRRVTRRLARVTASARALADGDDARPLPVAGRDELGTLARAFNIMAERVQDAKHRLEDQVAQRTAELRASEEQFRSLARTANDAIITADERGRIAYFNPAAERVFGYREDEAVGQSLTILMPERFREAHERGFARYLETGEARIVGSTVELTGRRDDGTEFPIELSLARWGDDDDVAFIAIARDITKRKETEAALRRYASDLEATNEELQAFSYSVSHDLRAPLRSMHGFSQALLEDNVDQLDARGTDYLTRICAAAERMDRLIDDLLELSRLTRSELRAETVDLTGIVRDVAEELRERDADRDVDFRIQEGLRAEGDVRLLRVAIENLVENGWKFSAGEPRACIEFGAVENDGDRAFFVRDNGTGFDMEYADQLFGAFQRLHAREEYPGSGIGLATVKRIVHRHGGRVWAEGAVGEGAAFYFTL